MEQLTITKIVRTNKDKQGKPLVTKDGRLYDRVAFKCREYGDKWIGGFGNKANTWWKEGSEIEVKVETNGEWLNFSMPSVWDEIKEIKARLDALEGGKAEADLEAPPEEDQPPF